MFLVKTPYRSNLMVDDVRGSERSHPDHGIMTYGYKLQMVHVLWWFP